MANTFSPSFAAYWSKRMQRTSYREAVYPAVVNMEEQETLKKGQTVHRPYRSTLYPRSYTRGTAVTIRDLTDTDETLTVTTAQVVPFYVDDLDALQHNYRVMNEYADDATTVLTNYIDGDVLGEYANATSKVDDVEINNGSTAGIGFTLSTANVLTVFTQAKKKLKKTNTVMNNLFGIISPEFEAVLMQFLANRETALGDSTGMNGNIGKYMGFELFVSNGCAVTAELLIGTQPTDGDTVIINGVTWTFKTTLGTTAGNVLIGGSATAAVTNLTNALNNAEGTAAGAVSALSKYVEVTAANRDLLIGLAATDGTTKVTIVFEGIGTVTLSETLTAAADVWTANKQIQHNLFGRKGAVDLVIQKRPNIDVKEVPDKLGKNVLPWTLYGLKTFAEGARELVDVRIRQDAF